MSEHRREVAAIDTSAVMQAIGVRELSTAAVALALALVECGLAILLLWGYGLSTIVLGHLIVVTALGVWVFQPARRSSRHRLLLWISTTMCGPFGPAGTLFALALEWHYARHATSLEEWHAMLFPPSHVDKHADLWRRVGQRASDRTAARQVTPFLDVLTFGSVPQRQAVIAIIAQQFHPAFAPALKAALRDEHNVIRVQAATAIARLENQLLERTMELEAEVNAAPGSPDAILSLATHYDDQAFTGLLDRTREQSCRLKAAALYEQYLRERAGDQSAELRFARLQLRMGRVEEAMDRLRRLAASGDASASLWLMESLFERGQYPELRAAASRFASTSDGTMAAEVSATVDLWAGKGMAA